GKRAWLRTPPVRARGDRPSRQRLRAPSLVGPPPSRRPSRRPVVQVLPRLTPPKPEVRWRHVGLDGEKYAPDSKRAGFRTSAVPQSRTLRSRAQEGYLRGEDGRSTRRR